MKGGCRVTYYCSSPGCYNEGEAHGESVENCDLTLTRMGWNVWTKYSDSSERNVFADVRQCEFLCPRCFEAWKKEHS